MQLQLDVGGHKVVVTDTAGLRESADQVEQQGIQRALVAASEADIVIHVVDAKADTSLPLPLPLPLPLSSPVPCKPIQPSLTVLNKMDLVHGPSHPPPPPPPPPTVGISCKTGHGMDALVQAIEQQIEQRLAVPHTQSPSASPLSHAVISQPRHRDLLRECAAHLQSVRAAGGGGGGSLLSFLFLPFLLFSPSSAVLPCLSHRRSAPSPWASSSWPSTCGEPAPHSRSSLGALT